jgi:hypothetical protein
MNAEIWATIGTIVATLLLFIVPGLGSSSESAGRADDSTTETHGPAPNRVKAPLTF